MDRSHGSKLILVELDWCHSATLASCLKSYWLLRIRLRSKPDQYQQHQEQQDHQDQQRERRIKSKEPPTHMNCFYFWKPSFSEINIEMIQAQFRVLYATSYCISLGSNFPFFRWSLDRYCFNASLALAHQHKQIFETFPEISLKW